MPSFKHLSNCSRCHRGRVSSRSKLIVELAWMLKLRSDMGNVSCPMRTPTKWAVNMQMQAY
eukprot:3210527-Amphidinium_carterae.2